MESTQKADIFPLEPFMQDGVEAQPVFEVSGSVSQQNYGEFMAMHYARMNSRSHWAFRIIGLALFALGLWDSYYLSGEYGALLCGVGFALFFTSLIQGRIVASSAARQWGGPLEFQCRFFEDGFEVYQDHAMARRPYSDLTEIVFARGVLYLYVARIRAYIITREALSGCTEEVIGLLERKTGKKAIRLDPEREE